MRAICNETDLSDLIASGYAYTAEPQYSDSVTAMDGTDYTAKLRYRVRLNVPFIPLTTAQLSAVLALFPRGGAYVDWTLYDPYAGGERTLQMKYETGGCTLACAYRDGTEYWSGLVIQLTER